MTAETAHGIGEFSGSTPYDPEALRQRRRIMVRTLVFSLALMGVKAAAFWVTGSKALFSDALESVVNVLTGTFGVFSVWLASRPPDRSHPYGHGKVEFFAAGIEGAFILAASFGIIRESVPRLLNPQPIENLAIGLGLSSVAGILNGVVGLFLIRKGKTVNSATLQGEGKHLFADTYTTIGVILGLVLVKLTGWLVLDSLAAMVVALWIAWSGVGLLREAAARLMDHSDPELLDAIGKTLAKNRRREWIEIHLLRARRQGDFVHIDFHLTFPRFWSLEDVHHEQSGLLEGLIQDLHQPGEVMIHPDPCRGPLCGFCQVDPCTLREAPFSELQDWPLSTLIAGPVGLEFDSCQELQAKTSRAVTRSLAKS